MIEVIFVTSLVGAFGAGSLLGVSAYERREVIKRRKDMRGMLGSSSILEALSISLECDGVSRWLIAYTIRLSKFQSQELKGVLVLFVGNWSKTQTLLCHAGVEGLITKEGFSCARRNVMGFACTFGSLLGALFSPFLAVIGFLAGAFWGWGALMRSLREEAQSRSFVAEKQLSQMIEIIILGLRSGMTFDRSLSLFHGNFKGSLSTSLNLAQNQWTHGLTDRSTGLRTVARSYDSALFERFAENVIRSLRFGTSLADNLSVLSAEARAIRKAKLEEKVAKAPVKMLLPVGALILPAMLIFIMGPIMLDLMQGF